MGNSKTKQQQQQIEALKTENRNLIVNMKESNYKIKKMEMEHKTAIKKAPRAVEKGLQPLSASQSTITLRELLMKYRTAQRYSSEAIQQRNSIDSGELLLKRA